MVDGYTIHRCLQHSVREAARLAGRPTADTCAVFAVCTTSETALYPVGGSREVTIEQLFPVVNVYFYCNIVSVIAYACVGDAVGPTTGKSFRNADVFVVHGRRLLHAIVHVYNHHQRGVRGRLRRRQ